jgi:molybdopterin-guanine dinucleotide biosynthesis protein B
MKVVGFAGYSGSGKTTLVERLIPALKHKGLRVSVVKHAHHRFDIDHAGKDTFRHREAGAFEVVAASETRMALMREFEVANRPTVHQLIAELDDRVDWVLVEGYKEADLLKLEVWRAQQERPARYMDDEFIVAVVTDSPQLLPVPTGLTVLDLNDPNAVADWMVAQGDRFDYNPESYA